MGKMLDAVTERLAELGWDADIRRSAGTFRLSQPTISGNAEAVVEGRFFAGAYLDEEIVTAVRKAAEEAAERFDVWGNVTGKLSGYDFTREDLIGVLMDAEEIKNTLGSLTKELSLEKLRAEVYGRERLLSRGGGGRKG